MGAVFSHNSSADYDIEDGIPLRAEGGYTPLLDDPEADHDEGGDRVNFGCCWMVWRGGPRGIGE
jgi:hypothetical protein